MKTKLGVEVNVGDTLVSSNFSDKIVRQIYNISCISIENGKAKFRKNFETSQESEFELRADQLEKTWWVHQ